MRNMNENVSKSLRLTAEYEIEVRDKDGRLLDFKRGQAHSWLKQFILALRCQCCCSNRTNTNYANTTLIDEGGTARTFFGANTHITAYGRSGRADEGIIVGSSDVPNSLDRYALGAKIAHGNASGQLMYGDSIIEDVVNPSGMDLQFRITRTFTNNSGAAVVVKEFGLLSCGTDNTATVRSYLVSREVLPSPSSIPDGASMTIRYIFKITVS